MNKFGVSQGIIDKALRPLKEQGLVTSFVGQGLFVGQLNASVPVHTVTTIRGDYPSSKGQEIAGELKRQLAVHHHRTAEVVSSQPERIREILKHAPFSDAYVVDFQPDLPVQLLDFLRQRSRAVVVQLVALPGLNVDSVQVDLAASIDLALRHLLALGHRRIAYASGEPEFLTREPVREFLRAHQWAGLASQPEPVLLGATKPGENAGEQMRNFLTTYLRRDGKLPFTALIVGSYVSAVGAAQALAAAGVSIPGDVSFVVLESPDLHVDKTHQFTMAGGTCQRIAAVIRERIETRWQHSDAPYEVRLVAPELVGRGSTAAPMLGSGDA